MNILFLALEPPFPPNDGGRIRTYNLLKATAQKHAVTLIAFCPTYTGNEAYEELKKFCETVQFVPLASPLKRSTLKKLGNLGRVSPIGLDKFRSVKMECAIKDLVSVNKFDLVHVDQINLAHYYPVFNSLPAVLTHHNVEACAQRRELMRRSDKYQINWWYSWLEHARWVHYESRVSRQFQALEVVSQQDADYFSTKVHDVPIFVVPNGVDTSFFSPKHEYVNPASLLFTGRMDYQPNVDAMNWFCGEILPLVRRKYPQVTLKIVGRNPVTQIKKLQELPGVTVTGTVPDVRPFFEASSIYIVPLRLGGGTRLKILEAMAMEMPIVSTHFGYEGLSVIPGRDIIAADTPADFSTQVMMLIEKEEYRHNLGMAAHETVVRAYDWSMIAQEQEKAYIAAINKFSNSN